jgi:predicted DNA binding protein/CheY-like chemotaxis protein/GAF domain-containing protein
MSGDALDVLLIEDNPGDARLIEEMLTDAADLLKRVDPVRSTADGSRIHHERTLSAGLERLTESDVDVILLDLGLPESTGLDTLATVADETEFVPIVVLTGLRDEQVGIEAIQRGAQDYLVKDDVASELLVQSIHHAIERNRQERDRARRREQLEAFNSLSRDLMEAESAEQVSEDVVEAADESLGLPATAIALYDDQKGTLRPVGVTDTAEVLVSDTSLLDIGEGSGWQAFIENDKRRVSVPREDTDGEVAPPITELAVFPLAQHGVFITGTTELDGFDATGFEFAETVAGNVEAAFDRVDRERQLQEREQTLEEKNRTLERLNRVNDIIRTIAQSLVQASTRREIEAVVCEQLADVGPYDLAYIGEYDAMAETIKPLESAGHGTEYLDALPVDTGDGEDAVSPSSLAVTDREPKVVDNIAVDRTFGQWRQEMLTRGYHATIALPLVYEETLYGVLNVFTGQSGVFDELEKTVLSELADTIAYAINAVESKKALVSDEVRRLQFTVTDPNLSLLEMSRELDCEIAVENLVPRSDGGVRSFFSTRGAPAADILEFAPRLSSVDLTLVSEYEEDGVPVCLFEADLTAESLTATVLDHGGRTQSLRVEDGVARVEVEVAADAAVREFVDMFQTKYPESELTAQRTQERPPRSTTELRASLTESLTERQLEAFQTAYFGGYFETPRERTAVEIAESMGISQPTFNNHLRAAQRKVCDTLFREKSLGD